MNKKNNILILPGDGIGPEVCNEAIKVLKYINDIYKLDIVIEESAVGGSAYEEFGNHLPEDTLKAAKEADAILLGAVGGPQWDEIDYELRPERALLGLRAELD